MSIGISDANTALLIGIAGGVDFALFYASGQIMDRFGRLWSAVPSMVGLGLGYLVLAFTPDLPTSVQWFIGVAMFMSVANGVGSGILMTLGADLAPREDPAPSSAWRFTGDAGSAASPLLIAALTSAASLAVASGVMGCSGSSARGSSCGTSRGMCRGSRGRPPEGHSPTSRRPDRRGVTPPARCGRCS